jgi:hypothetical protein
MVIWMQMIIRRFVFEEWSVTKRVNGRLYRHYAVIMPVFVRP